MLKEMYESSPYSKESKMQRFLKRGTLMGGIVGLLAIVLMSGTALAFNTPFTVDPSAVGEPQGPFTATFIQFGYNAEVDQFPTGNPLLATFDETGVATFTSYQHPNTTTPVSPLTSGLLITYELYLVFSATGTITPGGPLGVVGTFNTFVADLYLDPSSDNSVASLGAGDAGGADQSVTLTDPSNDDILVASTMGNGIESGLFNVSLSQAEGDFDVNVLMFALTGYFADWTSPMRFNLNGNNEDLFGLPAIPFGGATDIIIVGNGNSSVQPIPEPSTVLLLGSGLASIGLVRRLLRKKA
jgi:hypothetical protein